MKINKSLCNWGGILEVAILKNIDFGKNDGKNESEQDNFSNLFYKDEKYYAKLINDNHYIITGQKGTGKTILARYFAQNKCMRKNTVVKNLTATDFLKGKFLSFSRNHINDEELLIFWRYVYLREIAIVIITYIDKLPFYHVVRKNRIKRLKELLEKIQLIVETAEDSSERSRSNKLGIKTNLLKPKKNSTGDFSGEASKKYSYVQHFKKKEYFELIESLEQEIKANINKNEEYYLVYDDMDQLEEQMERREFIRLLQTMLYSADEFNGMFRNNGIKLRVIHVVRSDILDELTESSHNLIKTVSDYGMKIDWYSPKHSSPINNPLLKMVIHKIRSSVPHYKKMSNEKIYDLVFDQDASVLDFLLENSFGRPREIVQYLNILKDEYPNEEKILVTNLAQCLPIYSEWLYMSMLSEININTEVEEIKKVLELIKQRGYCKFKYKKLESFLEANSTIEIKDLLGTLKIMFKIGIVGTLNKNGTIEFSYRRNSTSEPTEISYFIVHNGLKKHMNVK